MADASNVDRIPLRRRIRARVSAFLEGDRSVLISWLMVFSAGAVAGAFILTDDYWSAILIEVGGGCGLLALLQLVPGRNVSALERVLLALAAVVTLLYAQALAGVRQAMAIEIGSGIALFIALDVYYRDWLEAALKSEDAKWKLYVLSLTVDQELVAQGIRDVAYHAEFEGSRPSAPRPVHIGTSEPDEGTTKPLRPAGVPPSLGDLLHTRPQDRLGMLPFLISEAIRTDTLTPGAADNYVRYVGELDRASVDPKTYIDLKDVEAVIRQERSAPGTFRPAVRTLDPPVPVPAPSSDKPEAKP
jgi:hypothetical protein